MKKNWWPLLILGLVWSSLQAQPQVVSIFGAIDSVYRERKSEEFRLDGSEFARGTVFRTRQPIFVTDGFDLVGDQISTLDSVAKTMQLFPNLRMEVRMCFSDSARASSLGRLDRLRASVVRDYLIRKGISSHRIRAGAGGAAFPIIPDYLIKMIPDPATRQKWAAVNERLEFVIVTPAFSY